MKRFEIVDVTCERCRVSQRPDGWTGRCSTCGTTRFRVEIERAASGWETIELEVILPRPSYVPVETGNAVDPYWSTRNFLMCAGVCGDEIAGFCGASIDGRRRMYVAWKRRELEASLGPGQSVCGRCGVIFKKYENEWNRSGYCSRSCGNAAAKSRRAESSRAD